MAEEQQSEAELPLLKIDETERILARLEQVVRDRRVVLVGGQAVTIWAAKLEGRIVDTLVDAVCTKVKGKQRCRTKLVSGTVKFTAAGAQATLSRHGVVYAAGTARTARGRMSLRLTPLRSLRSGRYTLTLISGTGKHETIRNESFTLI